LKKVSEADLSRANWHGLKPIAREVLAWGPINAVARHLSPRVPVAAKEAWFQGQGFRVKMLKPRHCQVAMELVRNNGRFAKESDNAVMDCLQEMARSSATFLDLGAYTGLFALVATKTNPALIAHAFEIVPETHRLAVANVAANDLQDRVTVHLHGLSDGPGKMTMPFDMHSTSLPSSLSIGSDFEGGVDIPIGRLDDFLPDLPGPVSLKIDVEGWEPKVLAGAAKLLATHRPTIIAEVLPGEGEAIQAILDPLGYSYWHFADKGLIQRERVEGVRRQRDWVFRA
jgi:FkbM family methyltransferase